MPAISSKPVNEKLAEHVKPIERDEGPLWTGPNGEGPNGGVTQGLVSRWLCCRERARISLIEGLRPPEQFSKALNYGQMWHTCEEALASGINSPTGDWRVQLEVYCRKLCQQFPLQQTEVARWYKVCRLQFPVYVDFWAKHPDVVSRTPLLQEQKFDVPYQLPSGRRVRLRGKWDSVDLVNGHAWLQENKSKGDVDQPLMDRMLRSGFELQTMLYLTALQEIRNDEEQSSGSMWKQNGIDCQVGGVRYNVIRRPLSGGKGTIKQGEGKPPEPHKPCGGTGRTPKKGQICSGCEGRGTTLGTPPETDDEFFDRLLDDYIAKEPETYFYRWKVRLLPGDIERFRRECLDPILEQICRWYDEITNVPISYVSYREMPQNFRMPYGVYSSLMDGGVTEIDRYADTGDRVGLERAEKLFPELED